jgi:hypothetical protein
VPRSRRTSLELRYLRSVVLKLTKTGAIASTLMVVFERHQGQVIARRRLVAIEAPSISTRRMLDYDPFYYGTGLSRHCWLAMPT